MAEDATMHLYTDLQTAIFTPINKKFIHRKIPFSSQINMLYEVNQTGLRHYKKTATKTIMYIYTSFFIIFIILLKRIFFHNVLDSESDILDVFLFSSCIFFGIYMPFVNNGKIIFNTVNKIEIDNSTNTIKATTFDWFFLHARSITIDSEVIKDRSNISYATKNNTLVILLNNKQNRIYINFNFFNNEDQLISIFLK